MKHCKWCGVFVRLDQPAFTWHRAFGPMEFIGDRYQQVGPDYGWTEPKVLCPSCAESAHGWDNCHKGLFAEVGP